ncbi:MAG: N-acetyltransferase family protein [Leptothrix sp. (in: b-proteobacteria)]
MTTPPTTVRLASLSDVDAVAALFDAYRQFYEQIPDLGTATAFIRERLSRDESVILLAEDAEGQPLGFCQLYPTFCSVEAAPIYVLYDLFVTPAGRRSGTGAALLRAAEQHAHRTGRVRMDLTTAHTNHSAQRLYESLGWVHDEIFRTYNRRVVG